MTALQIQKLHNRQLESFSPPAVLVKSQYTCKMQSATLDTAASVLLLSSVVSLGLLLKRTPTSRLKSSNSVLSISDVTSSVLTAVLVFFHQFYIGNDDKFDYRISKLNNTRYFYETVFKSRSEYDGNSTSLNDKSIGDECEYKSVILQYAMFLVPFVNAFISLLSFSTSFYANAMKMNCQCCALTCNPENLEKSSEKSEKDTKTPQSSSESREYKTSEKNTRKPKFFNGKYTNLAIIGQWIIPALFTSIFQLGKYQKIDVSNDVTQDLICTITANFPFENCIDSVNSTSGILSVDSVGSYSSAHDYVSSEDNILWPHPNSSEVQDVVSKIYGIVWSVTNDSKVLNSTLPDRHYNISQLVDVMSRKNFTTVEDLEFGGNYTDSKEKFGRKYESYVMHSFANKVLNDNEQSQMNNVLITKCLKNRCMISTKFLKIYLFVLLTLIYFAPIFVSALILMKSYYKCKEITEKLENSKLKLESQLKHSEIVDTQNVDETNVPQQQSNALNLGWFSENGELAQEVVADVEETEQKEPTETFETPAFEKMACELSCETEKMRSLFKIFRVHAMVAVALWTPFFLQILSKVFLCSNVPNWLMETTFLATIIFSIFKNAVNVNVVKIEADAEKLYKRNTVYPSKLDLS